MSSILKVDTIQTAAGGTPTAAGLGINITGSDLPAGSVVGVQHYTNNTRTAVSSLASYALWTGISFNKQYTNSKLIITGQLVFRDGESYFMGEYWKIGASGNRYDGIIQHGYASDAGDVAVQFGWTINAQYDSTETGSLAVEIGWNVANGGSNQPGSVWNPSSADDGRIQGTKTSTLTIMEVLK